MASRPEDDLFTQIELFGLPTPQREYRFHNKRKWRFDFAFPGIMFAIEVHGGGWVNGRHHRPGGFRKDCEKMAFAAIDGWTAIAVTPEQVRSGEAIEWIRLLIERIQT